MLELAEDGHAVSDLPVAGDAVAFEGVHRRAGNTGVSHRFWGAEAGLLRCWLELAEDGQAIGDLPMAGDAVAFKGGHRNIGGGWATGDNRAGREPGLDAT